MPNIIPALQRLCIPAENPLQPDATIAFFDIPVIPRVPLCVGQEVKILALVSCSGLFPTEGQQAPPYYTAKETGVEGKIVRVRAVDASVTEFVVKNDNTLAGVTHAYLAIQHIQGRTVNLSLGRRILRAITRPATAERQIPLELDATIFWDAVAARPAQLDDGRTVRGAGPVERRIEDAERDAGRMKKLGQYRGRTGVASREEESEATGAGDT